MGAQGTDAIPALLEAIEDEKTPVMGRMAAALMIVAFSQFPTFRVDSEAVEAADAVFAAGLRDPDPDVHTVACGMMCNVRVPKSAIDQLKELRRNAGPTLRVYIAAALAAAGIPDIDSLAVLRRVLEKRDGGEEKDEALERTAAIGLARQGFHSGEPIDVLIDRFETAGHGLKHAILLGWRELGPVALKASETIAEVIADELMPIDLRTVAAATLGSVTKGTDKGASTFKRALRSNRTPLVEAALFGLSEAGHFTDKVVRQVAVLLSSDRPSLRRWSAMALSAAGPHVVPVIPELMDRIGTESDPVTLNYVTDALGEAGEPAISAVLELVKSHHPARIEPAVDALIKIGVTAGLTLVDWIAEENHDWAAVSLFKMLRTRGSEMSPVVRRMAEILEETGDEEKALILVMAVEEVEGEIAAIATKGLIAWVMKGSDELALWCKRALFKIGPSVLPHLSSALVGAGARARERLLAVINLFEDVEAPAIISDERLIRLRKLDKKALLIFVHVCDLLIECGPLADEDVVQYLQDRTDPKKWKGTLLPKDVAIKRRTFQKYRKKCEEALGIPMTRRVKGRAGEITPEAIDYLELVREYVRTL